MIRNSTRNYSILIAVWALILGAEAMRRRSLEQGEKLRLKAMAFEASADNMAEFARRQEGGSFRPPGEGPDGMAPSSDLLRRRAHYYRDLAKKYRDVAKKPWFQPPVVGPLPD